jgi:preprotein translocase subunit SecE
MAKEKNATSAPMQGMLHFGLYKRSQGRIARQATFLAIVALVAIGAWRVSQLTVASAAAVKFGVPVLIVGVGALAAFWLVNYPKFADFLIAVEAEMNQVSWPSWPELYRASMVVLFTIFFLAVVLFGFDLAWRLIFQMVGIVGGTGSGGD